MNQAPERASRQISSGICPANYGLLVILLLKGSMIHFYSIGDSE